MSRVEPEHCRAYGLGRENVMKLNMLQIAWMLACAAFLVVALLAVAEIVQIPAIFVVIGGLSLGVMGSRIGPYRVKQ